MKLDTRRYQSYLLRLWRDDVQGEWRASLQDTLTCQKYFFPDLASLYGFLDHQAAQAAPVPGILPAGEPPAPQSGAAES